MNSIVLAGIMIAVAGVMSVHGVTPVWSSEGPYGGDIQIITVDPAQPNRLYASVGWGGGIFISRNWGLSWEAVPIFYGNDFKAMALSADGGRLYVAIGKEMYRSLDHGDTWTYLSNVDTGTTTAGCIALDPVNPDVLYVGTVDRVRKSVNGGLSWFTASTGLPAAQMDRIYVDPFAPGTLYVAVDYNGIYRSTNGGTSWTRIYAPFNELPYVACHPRIPDRLYACNFDPVGFAISDDGGDEWRTVANGPYFWEMAFDPADDDRLYAQSIYGGYTSADGGETWVPLTPYPGRSIAVDPTEPETLYAGTLKGVFRSTDRGDSWFTASNGISEVILSLAVPPTEAGMVYAGDYSHNIFKSLDGGLNWANLPFESGSTRISSLAVRPDNSDVLFANSIELYRSVDGGYEWDALGGGYFWKSVYQPNPPHGLFVCSGWAPYMGETHSTAFYYGLQFTLNNGNSWAYRGLTQLNIVDVAINPADQDIMFAGGYRSLYRSDDGGLSWDNLDDVGPLRKDGQKASVVSDAVVTSIVFDPSHLQHVYVGAREDTGAAAVPEGVYRSTDGGDTWNRMIDHVSVLSLAVDPSAPGALYAGSETGLFHSPDDGMHWNDVNPALDNFSVNALAFGAGTPRRLYVGTNRGMFVRTTYDSPTVKVHYRNSQTGTVDKELPAQLLPSSYLTFAVPPEAFPGAASSPVIIEIQLPEGAFLSQTLATGTLSTASPGPGAGEQVFPLAVSEYGFNPESMQYEPVTSGRPASINDDSVQLFRYVAGEDKIWLRVTRSTST
ncbi:MAG: hypothetical protein JXQ27_14270, partial [Acidobacteria bacterium]|nr:hypothetical protein [Acidobacteriota bacterium]